MTTKTNTQIQSFGYVQRNDEKTMSLFAVLQNQNKREIESVLNGTADDVGVVFDREDKDQAQEQDVDENDCRDSDVDFRSALQRELKDNRSDDEGGTLADELSALVE